MVIFNLKEYWEHTINEPRILAEPTAKYILKSKEKTYQYADKIIKDILSDKKEFINFIKKYMKNEEFGRLREEEIEMRDKEFITSQLKKRESDIIYEVLDRNIYVLVEHQSKIDYNMPERIAEYCIQLINYVKRNRKDEYRAKICPIVLYTGNKRWDAPLTIKQKGEYPRIFPPLEYPTYNLIEVSDYQKSELLAENSAISKVLLFEKIKTKKDIENILKELLQKELTEEEKRCIQLILTYSNKIRELLSKEKIQNIKEIIEGGSGSMRFEELYLELLEDKFKLGKKEGSAKTISQIVKEMLKNHMSDEQIIQITKIEPKELERLKMV